MMLHHRVFNNLQILQEADQIEGFDLLTIESECAVSYNFGTLLRLQENLSSDDQTLSVAHKNSEQSNHELFFEHANSAEKAVIQ
jgi:hypothetical protein